MQSLVCIQDISKPMLQNKQENVPWTEWVRKLERQSGRCFHDNTGLKSGVILQEKPHRWIDKLL